VVVEKSHDVINLVWPHLLKDEPEARAKTACLHNDLFEYLQDLKSKPHWPYFTHAYYDIWTSDSENTFFKTVCPLITLSDTVIKNRPICWNENVMRGQLWMGLESRAYMAKAHADSAANQSEAHKDMLSAWPTLEALRKPIDSIWHDWAIPFWNWVARVNPDEALLSKGIKAYITFYGLPRWERYWENMIGMV
jgi:hypothetical protein